MSSVERVISLDIGEKRIGVARGDSQTKIAIPEAILENDENFIKFLNEMVNKYSPVAIVVGLPRNSSGEETKQSQYVREFAARLDKFGLPIVFQDESLTSVEAKNTLASLRVQRSNPVKERVDSRAAAIILSDYLEQKYGR